MLRAFGARKLTTKIVVVSCHSDFVAKLLGKYIDSAVSRASC